MAVLGKSRGWSPHPEPARRPRTLVPPRLCLPVWPPRPPGTALSTAERSLWRRSCLRQPGRQQWGLVPSAVLQAGDTSVPREAPGLEASSTRQALHHNPDGRSVCSPWVPGEQTRVQRSLSPAAGHPPGRGPRSGRAMEPPGSKMLDTELYLGSGPCRHGARLLRAVRGGRPELLTSPRHLTGPTLWTQGSHLQDPLSLHPVVSCLGKGPRRPQALCEAPRAEVCWAGGL